MCFPSLSNIHDRHTQWLGRSLSTTSSSMEPSYHVPRYPRLISRLPLLSTRYVSLLPIRTLSDVPPSRVTLLFAVPPTSLPVSFLVWDHLSSIAPFLITSPFKLTARCFPSTLETSSARFPIPPRRSVLPTSCLRIPPSKARTTFIVGVSVLHSSKGEIGISRSVICLYSNTHDRVIAAFHYGNITYPSRDPPRIGFVSTVPPDADQKLKVAFSEASQRGGGFPGQSSSCALELPSADPSFSQFRPNLLRRVLFCLPDLPQLLPPLRLRSTLR